MDDLPVKPPQPHRRATTQAGGLRCGQRPGGHDRLVSGGAAHGETGRRRSRRGVARTSRPGVCGCAGSPCDQACSALDAGQFGHATLIVGPPRIGKRLLAETDQEIISICFSSGFNDLAHFYRIFKRYTSLSPRQFRLNAGYHSAKMAKHEH
ncbi:helix-turn-helix domain-containing protein [Cytophagia bacterium CHB2]|nr:helix-turn-helix domain-containing protein [Cytophagia bacterium CHB2]